MNIKNISEFFQDAKAINFVKYLKKDKRRLLLFKKVIGVLFQYSNKRLTFDELLEKTNLCRSSLASVINRLRRMNMISDYDVEKIAVKKSNRGGFEYTTKIDEERFYYRYRYRFTNSDETTMLLAVIWSLNIISQDKK